MELIKSNVEMNTEVIKAPVTVMPLDFYQPEEWCEELSAVLGQVDVVLAADGKLTTFSQIRLSWVTYNYCRAQIFTISLFMTRRINLRYLFKFVCIVIC